MRSILQSKKAQVVAIVVVALAATAGAARGSYPHARFKHPQLKRGVLIVKGTPASDKIALRLKPGDPTVLQVDVGDNGVSDFSFARQSIAKIMLDSGAGADNVRIDDSNGSFTDAIPTTIAGGPGADTIAGGKGAETLSGGDGNDTIDGNGGNDISSLGSGDDTFVWDPGDGSDSIEGQQGTDTMVFNGAAAAEPVDLSANGGRLRFFRNPGGITMDTSGVEVVDFNALGGADVVTVNDLSATDVTSLNVDLGVNGAGDRQADRVIVNGTNGNDAITVNGDAASVKVSGLAAAVNILHGEIAFDRLDVNTLAGRDTVDSAGLGGGAIQLIVNGALRSSADVLMFASLASTSAKGTVVALRKTGLGSVLVDGHGHTLYAFAKDKHDKSACYGACAAYWPALVSSAKARPGKGVRGSLLGLTKRADGKRQVTYAGHPLYRFSGDTKPGDTTGEGLTDFGGAWDVVGANGRPITAPSTGSSTGGYGG